MLAMSRDRDCTFKAYNQIKYYSAFYHFSERHVQIRTERATKVLDSLKDSKVQAIQQAVRMIQTQQIPLRDKKGNAVLDAEGNAMFVSVDPDHKELKTAWEIIKTELGEPTSIGKQDITSKGEKVGVLLSAEQEAKLENMFAPKEWPVQVGINNIASHGNNKPQTNTNDGADYERQAPVPQNG